MNTHIVIIKRLALLFLSALSIHVHSQETILEVIDETVTKSAAKKCISYLASDEMRGRGTGTDEIDLAADYLADEFNTGGIDKLPGKTDHFQEVEMIQPFSPTKVSFTLEDDSFSYVDDLLMLYHGHLSFKGEVVFVGYGQDQDFADVDATGKVVVSLAGNSANTTGQTYTSEDLHAKQLRTKGSGASALIEIMTFEDVEWDPLSDFLVAYATEIKHTNEKGYIPHVWLRN